MQRIYKISNNISNNIDVSKQNIFELDTFILDTFKKDNTFKLIETSNVTKKRYQNIFQEIKIKDKKEFKKTYVDEYIFVKQEEKNIIFKYNKTILDDKEFPPLNKYDFEESYDEQIYEIMYKNKKCKLISNKYESFIEVF